MLDILRDKFNPSIYKLIENEVKKYAKDSDVNLKVLDLGAGSAKYWESITRNIDCNLDLTLLDGSEVQNFIKIKPGCTIHHVKGMVPGELNSIGDDAFDIVIAIDLIEHLDKSDGYKLLYEMDRVSRRLSIIFTPNGFVWQPPSINNPLNAHISGWRPNELSSLGWTRNYGFGGLKFLVGPYGIPKSSNLALKLLRRLSIFIVFNFPRFAFSFAAVKSVKNPRLLKQEL